MTLTVEVLGFTLLRVRFEDHRPDPGESTTVERAADLADDMIDVFRSPIWRWRRT